MKLHIMKTNLLKRTVILSFILLIGISSHSEELRKLTSLSGFWKFSIGDDIQWAGISYNDSRWDQLSVPGRWENQGYDDYNGYAWYRKTIVYNSNTTDDRMVLLMGKIDDIDQVYINGTLVGSTGTFPSKSNRDVFPGAEYNAFRGYYLPAGFLKKGQKYVIAVRVLDTGGTGGIYEGPVGIISQSKYIEYWRKNKSNQ